MRITQSLWQHRQPMIRFLGRRQIPKQVDHSPHAHPASPDPSLPESFARYRDRAIQHGPLGGKQQQQSQGGSRQTSAGSSSSSSSSSVAENGGAIGGRSAKQLGPIKLEKGEVFDRNELPRRFQRTNWSTAEIEAVESGGASLFS